MDDKTLRRKTFYALRIASMYLGHAVEADLMQDCVTRPQKALALIICVLSRYDPMWIDAPVGYLLRDEAMSRDETLSIAIDRVDMLEAENERLRGELKEAWAQLSRAHGAVAFVGISSI